MTRYDLPDHAAREGVPESDLREAARRAIDDLDAVVEMVEFGGDIPTEITIIQNDLRAAIDAAADFGRDARKWEHRAAARALTGPERQVTPESVAFLLEHQRYRGCTMASLTIRERLEGVEAAARALTGPERQVKPAQPDELQRLTEALAGAGLDVDTAEGSDLREAINRVLEQIAAVEFAVSKSNGPQYVETAMATLIEASDGLVAAWDAAQDLRAATPPVEPERSDK